MYERNALRAKWVALVFGGALALLSGLASAAGNKPTAKEQKVSVYIDIVNSESSHVVKAYSGYTKLLADPKKGPTCKENDVQRLSPGAMGDSAPDRYKGWRKALAKGPKLDPDAFAGEMLDALEALYAPGNEAATYYFENKYKTDGCKRGQELHPVLMANWTRYMQAEQKMREFLEKYTDERDAADLVSIQKKQGKALHYYHRKVMVDAKALIRVVDQQQFSLDAVRTSLAGYSTTLDEAKVVLDKAYAGKERDALYQGGYKHMIDTAFQLKNMADELIRAVETEAKEANSKMKSVGARDRAMKNFFTYYNQLVDNSNKVMYTKSMK